MLRGCEKALAVGDNESNSKRKRKSANECRNWSSNNDDEEVLAYKRPKLPKE